MITDYTQPPHCYPTLTYVWRNLHGMWVACRSGLWWFGHTPEDALAGLRERYIEGPALIFFSGTKPFTLERRSWNLADMGTPCAELAGAA